MDRRKATNMKEVIIPVVVATLVGAFSSYVATLITLERVETKIVYIEKDLVDFKDLVKIVAENQKELLVRGVWMENTEIRQTRTENRIKEIEDRLRSIENNGR